MEKKLTQKKTDESVMENKNTRRLFIRQIGLAGLAISLGIPKQLLAAEKTLKLTILQTNDIHCHIDPFPPTDPRNGNQGGLARIAGLIHKIKKEDPHVLLFDSGDYCQGTPYFNFFGGELIISLMNKMGYMASTIGNHEFDNGMTELAKVVDKADFPMINSNYDFTETPMKGKTLRNKIIEVEGYRIGIYGLGVALDGLVLEQNYANTCYLDPLKTALEMEEYLHKKEHCDLIICLSHLGYQYKGEKHLSDLNLAAQTHFTDLILGGHSHTFLKEATEVTNLSGKKTLVNQAGWGGLRLGRIDVEIGKAGKQLHSRDAVRI